MKTKQQLIKEVKGKTPAEQSAIDVLTVLTAIALVCVAGAFLNNEEPEPQPAPQPVKYITTCLLTQNNEVHEYPNCTVINDKYARLN